jgi:iron complex transport system ATP-binding protein
MNSTHLSFDNVTFGYTAERPLLRELSLHVEHGQSVALLGPNGVGKTTLLKLATGILKPTSGTVCLDGDDVSILSRADIARRIAIVPQRVEVAFDFSVFEMVLMGTCVNDESRWGFETPRMRARAEHAIDQTCLHDLRERTFSSLSGGEQQRVLLARAIAQGATLLFLDEPSASLDIAHKRGLFTILKQLNAEKHLTIVTIMHDLELASHHLRDVAVLHNGGIVKRGNPTTVLTPELLLEVYNVRADVHYWEDGGLSVRLRS